MGKARTVKRTMQGKRELRLVEQDGRFYGLADGKICVEGSDEETVWSDLHIRAGMVDPDYIGYEGARRRFSQFFPNGFHSEHFEGQERKYKFEAAHRLASAAPLDRALNEVGFGEAVLAAYRKTNLLSPFEKAKVADLLRSDGADRFVQAAAAFTKDPDTFSLNKLVVSLKPSDCAKWTIITYLPFLWDPKKHMYLKPLVTQDFARRVGHAFADIYTAQPDMAVYRSLLDLVEETAGELQEMEPRDNIDIQSLIWVVGDYQDGQEPPNDGDHTPAIT